MINQLAAGLMVVQGVVLGVVAYVFFRKRSAKLAACRRMWGDVIDVREHSGGEGPTKHPVIRYKTERGEEVTFESRFGSSNWEIKPGDRLEILANADNPSDAEVVNFMAQWGLPIVLAIASAGSILGAVAVYVILRR